MLVVERLRLASIAQECAIRRSGELRVMPTAGRCVQAIAASRIEDVAVASVGPTMVELPQTMIETESYVDRRRNSKSLVVGCDRGFAICDDGIVVNHAVERKRGCQGAFGRNEAPNTTPNFPRITDIRTSANFTRLPEPLPCLNWFSLQHHHPPN